MSMRLSSAAANVYDALKRRPGAPVRRSDARRPEGMDAIQRRLRELVDAYRIGGHPGPAGATYVFWSEIQTQISAGAFDDLLDAL